MEFAQLLKKFTAHACMGTWYWCYDGLWYRNLRDCCCCNPEWTCRKEAEVILDGGNLHISWEGDSSAHVFMTGPAEKVFEGEYII